MKKVIICTVCPNGCEVTAEYTNKEDVVLTGNKCKRGVEYCINECFEPKRTFTSSVKIKGATRKMLPVRTTKPVAKDLLLNLADAVHKIEVDAPVKNQQIICENILGTDADLVATMTLEGEK